MRHGTDLLLLARLTVEDVVVVDGREVKVKLRLDE
jgi:hypothetical protein